MLSSQNVAIVKIPFRSRVMGFLIIAYCRVFIPMGKGFSTGNNGTVEPSTLHRHKQMISGEETHALTTSMVSIMTSDIVDGL